MLKRRIPLNYLEEENICRMVTPQKPLKEENSTRTFRGRLLTSEGSLTFILSLWIRHGEPRVSLDILTRVNDVVTHRVKSGSNQLDHLEDILHNLKSNIEFKV